MVADDKKVFVWETRSLDVLKGESADDVCRNEVAGLISAFSDAVRREQVNWRIGTFLICFTVELSGFDIKIIMRAYEHE